MKRITNGQRYLCLFIGIFSGIMTHLFVMPVFWNFWGIMLAMVIGFCFLKLFRIY